MNNNSATKFVENNFKAVLESIRDLMNEEYAVPPWLHDILLGYGEFCQTMLRRQQRAVYFCCVFFGV